jgi:fucose permease
MKRYCLALDLKGDPALIAEYEAHHRKVWPEILASIKESGIEHMESFIIMAIVGGAIMPPIMGLIADHVGIQEGFVVPLVCFLFVIQYGLKGYEHKAVQ